MRVDSNGRLLSIVMGGLIEARLEAEEDAKRIEAGADLFVAGLVKIDKPLGDPVTTKRLVVEVTGASVGQLASGPRQSVSREASTGAVLLTLGGGSGANQVAGSKEVEDALSETAEYPIKLPRVVELAREAVGDASTVRGKVERLVHFVHDYLEDEVHPDSLSVSGIIAAKRGDCTEHATLFVALARAVGVPAREVRGLMYMGDEVKAFGGHAWNEVVIDGEWVAVDATWGQLEVDATHLTLSRQGVREEMRDFLPRLTFRLREVEHAAPATK